MFPYHSRCDAGYSDTDGSAETETGVPSWLLNAFAVLAANPTKRGVGLAAVEIIKGAAEAAREPDKTRSKPQRKGGRPGLLSPETWKAVVEYFLKTGKNFPATRDKVMREQGVTIKSDTLAHQVRKYLKGQEKNGTTQQAAPPSASQPNPSVWYRDWSEINGPKP